MKCESLQTAKILNAAINTAIGSIYSTAVMVHVSGATQFLKSGGTEQDYGLSPEENKRLKEIMKAKKGGNKRERDEEEEEVENKFRRGRAVYYPVEDIQYNYWQ